MSRRATLRKTLQWLAAIVLVGSLAGGGYAWWVWTNQNALLLDGLRAKLAQIAPEWTIEIGSARFDWSRRIHVYNVALKAPGQTSPILLLPEAVLTVDRRKLNRDQTIEVQKVRLLNAELELVRRADGRWNWQDLPPLPVPDEKKSCPEWAVDQATVRVRLEKPRGEATASIEMKQAALTLVPSGKRTFLFTGATEVEQIGKLTVEGQWDLDARTWLVNGQMQGVPLTAEQFKLAQSIWPRLKVGWALPTARQQGASTDNPQDRVVGTAHPAAGTGTAERTPAFADVERPLVVTGTLDAGFRIARWSPGAAPQMQMLLGLDQGRITSPSLPFPLHDVAGKLYFDERRIVLEKLVARNGVTHIELGGSIIKPGESVDSRSLQSRQGRGTVAHGASRGKAPSAPAGAGKPVAVGESRNDESGGREPASSRFDVQLTGLPLDDRVRVRLPAAWRQVYDSLRLSGPVDLKTTFVDDGRGNWTARGVTLTARGCRATPEAFPYPLHGITGTIKERDGNAFAVELNGFAGRREMTVRGFVRNPGREGEVVLDFYVEGLPLDETLLAACRTDARETLESLNLEGSVDGLYRLYRLPGPGQALESQLLATVKNASLECEAFPYRITDLTGKVTFSSLTETWELAGLSASHGSARIHGGGTFVKPDGRPGRLELEIEASGAHLDRQLELALPKSLQELWTEFSPGGQIDTLAAEIDWSPGQPAQVVIPALKISGGRMLAKSFPYPIEDIKAEFAYEPATAPGGNDVLKIISFAGRHDETPVAASGFVEFTPQGEWRARIQKFHARQLVADRAFRRALPRDLRTVVEELDPEGSLTLAGLLEFRGTDRPQDPVTAAWDVEITLAGNSLTTGIELRDLHGRVTARGTWDGGQAVMRDGNRIELDAVTIHGYRLTDVKGPYRLNERGDGELIVGSRQSLLPMQQGVPLRPIRPEDQLTARAIGGLLTLDAAARLDDSRREIPYRVKVTLRDGRLEQYAREYLSGAANLRGAMNGWIDVYGRGSTLTALGGRGQLQINPAALYELPIIVSIFKVLKFVPPDKTAFKYAMADFAIRGGYVNFSTIDLVGDAMSLRGRGRASFDGQVALEFFSMLPRNQLPIPIIQQLVSTATSGWVGITVTGRLSDPRATVRAVPQLEDGMRRFLDAFGTGTAAIPRLMLAPLASPPPRTRR